LSPRGTTLIDGVRDADAIAISLEPAGGSVGPTKRTATVELT
jgi:anti-sigma-K factor RskA